MDTSNEIELINFIAKGDQHSLQLIMDRYRPMVLKLANRLLCDEQVSKDIAQEVFIRVWQKAHRFNPQYALSTWIYSITCHLCYDQLRRHRWLLPLSRLGFLPDEKSDNSVIPLEQREMWSLYKKVSQSLPVKQRMVFTLREIEGYDTQETARLLGMTADQVKSNLSQAKKTVRAKLEKYEIR